jgi:AcrR family transcriptional regulator
MPHPDYGYNVAEYATTSSPRRKPGVTIDLMAEPARRPQDAAPTPGSPAWWSARAVPPPERGRGRPPRSFENIVSVAADLVDELGVDGVNMRLLAQRLETGTATLYRHVSGKDELMVYVLDSRMGEIVGAYDAHSARPRSWREALERIAFAYRGFLDAHPNVLPLLVGRLPVGPHALTIRERSLAALTEHGFSQALAARAFTTLLQYVVGSAVTQAGSPAPDEAVAIRDYYRSLDAAVYPHVAAAAEALTHTPREAGFVEGLDIVLDGIDRTHRRSAR